jgi:hypothetical protein
MIQMMRMLRVEIHMTTVLTIRLIPQFQPLPNQLLKVLLAFLPFVMIMRQWSKRHG